MSLKRELVFHSDLGIVGTFSRWVEKTTEVGYKYLEYVPLNNFPPKRKLLATPIHQDHIHTLHSSSSEPGVEERIIFIYTGQAGSLINNVLKNDDKKTIAELRERIRKLQMQVASTKQSEEDARSGVNKQISSMRNATKQSGGDGFNQYPQSPFNNYGGGGDNFEQF